MQSYVTVRQKATAELIEKRSRFIAQVFPIKDEQEALSLIANAKKEYWDARHNVYAYILREGGICRYTDDGEPSGTAGVPVLDVLKKRGVTDCLVIVTRYFGGVLLGTGGLVRAYSGATSLGLDAAGVVVAHPCTLFSIQCPYPDYEQLLRLCDEQNATVDSTDFLDSVTLNLLIKTDAFHSFKLTLTDKFSGRLTAKAEGEKYGFFDE